METNEQRRPAALLLGPTGSGKTPLGDLLAERGLWGRPCVHLDFGHELRRLAAGERSDASLSADDLAFIARVLDEGALLENEHFPIARRIVTAFLRAEDPAGEALLVLNGLPRHIGQAADLDTIAAVETVIHLFCTPAVVRERIRTDPGGDRTGRVDDAPEAVAKKLDLFARRAVPLLEYYGGRGARVETMIVSATATPPDVWEELDGRR